MRVGAFFLLLSCVSPAARGEPGWRDRARRNPRTASLPNPYAEDPEAAKAGAKLYGQHCSSCHGTDGRGSRRSPPVHSPAVAEAQPGELYWLLRNGSLRRGMPSWSHLPPEQRWQLVAWLKSMQR